MPPLAGLSFHFLGSLDYYMVPFTFRAVLPQVALSGNTLTNTAEVWATNLPGAPSKLTVSGVSSPPLPYELGHVCALLFTNEETKLREGRKLAPHPTSNKTFSILSLLCAFDVCESVSLPQVCTLAHM